jgi:hypothetical protein
LLNALQGSKPDPKSNEQEPAHRRNNARRQDGGIEGAVAQRHTRQRKDHARRTDNYTKHQQNQIHTPNLYRGADQSNLRRYCDDALIPCKRYSAASLLGAIAVYAGMRTLPRRLNWSYLEELFRFQGRCTGIHPRQVHIEEHTNGIHPARTSLSV